MGIILSRLPMPSTWLCCIPLRNGSIMMGAIGILEGLLYFVHDITLLKTITGMLCLVSYGSLFYGAIREDWKAVLCNIVADTVLIFLNISLAIFHILDVELVVPEPANMCFASTETGFDLNDTMETPQGYQPSCDEMKNSAAIKGATLYFSYVIFHFYVWICNLSYYLELIEDDS